VRGAQVDDGDHAQHFGDMARVGRAHVRERVAPKDAPGSQPATADRWIPAEVTEVRGAVELDAVGAGCRHQPMFALAVELRVAMR
jgi:hypothetical protein